MPKSKDVKIIDIRTYQQQKEFDDFLQTPSTDVRVVKGEMDSEASFYEDAAMMQGGGTRKKGKKNHSDASSVVSSEDDASSVVSSEDDASSVVSSKDDASSVVSSKDDASSVVSSEDSKSSIDTINLLSQDPLYLVLGQFFSTATGKNIVMVLDEINENLKLLLASTK